MPHLRAGLVSSVDIEEIAPRRDYRLAYIFGCASCVNSQYEKAPTIIFLFRTDEDLKLMRNNIYQSCIQHHITRPFRRCTKCNKVYTVDDSVCMECEQTVADVAMCEVYIEEALKAAAKVEKQFRRKKIQQAEYSAKLEEFNSGINEARRELAKIEEMDKKKYGK